MSTIDATLTSPVFPFFTVGREKVESPTVQDFIQKLNLQQHPEGGYFNETDRDHLRVPNPFQAINSGTANHVSNGTNGTHDDDSTRSASTTIFYLLTTASPQGVFHRNKGRTMHTLHKGRGRYTIIHADGQLDGRKARIETFVVGSDIHKGERLRWLVEGGKYKASHLLPDTKGGGDSEGLLISEVSGPVVSPGIFCAEGRVLTIIIGLSYLDLSFPITTSCLLRDYPNWYLGNKQTNCAGYSPIGHE